VVVETRLAMERVRVVVPPGRVARRHVQEVVVVRSGVVDPVAILGKTQESSGRVAPVVRTAVVPAAVGAPIGSRRGAWRSR
jgi:hypothetical protein